MQNTIERTEDYRAHKIYETLFVRPDILGSRAKEKDFCNNIQQANIVDRKICSTRAVRTSVER